MTRRGPTADERSAPFFEGAARGTLMLQRCTNCGDHHFPITEVCTNCLETAMEWVGASGDGTLFTFGVMHHLYHPSFKDELPYNVSVVELAEGPRMNAHVDAPNEELEVGMALQVAFDSVDGVAVPIFRPV